MKTTSYIDLLVTVDPVSYSKPSINVKPQNIKYYINIYIDYFTVGTNFNNTVARLGSPWQSVKWADVNHNIIKDTQIQYDHAAFGVMFDNYAANHVMAIK